MHTYIVTVNPHVLGAAPLAGALVAGYAPQGTAAGHVRLHILAASEAEAREVAARYGQVLKVVLA
jgi:hypothetical protein